MDKLTAPFPLLRADKAHAACGFTSTGAFLFLDAGAKKILRGARRVEVCAPAGRTAPLEARA